MASTLLHRSAELPSSLRNVQHAYLHARQRAMVRGAPSYLRVRLSVGDADPWGLLQGVDLNREQAFAWHDGRSGKAIAALGNIASHPADAERFASQQLFAQALLDGVVDVAVADGGVAVDDPPAVADLPLLVGGFAFAESSPRHADADGWGQWPAALMWLPEVMVVGQLAADGRWSSVVSINVEVSATAEPQGAHVWLRAVERATSLRVQLAAAQQRGAPPPSNEVRAEQDESFAHWCERVFGARNAVARRQLAKVVLARRITLQQQQPFESLDALWRLRRAYPAAITFAVALRERGVFLGATPEVLVGVEGRNVRTQALAGTAPRASFADRTAQEGQALLDSRKDGAEHRIVAEAIVEALQPVCRWIEFDPAPALVTLPYALHLETRIRGELHEPGGILQLVARLHPTPAVGGWPRASALRWLQREEAVERGWYAGPVGWMTAAGDGLFAVAIRSGLLRGNRAIAYAGAGIVAESNPQAEWHETLLKLQPFCAATGAQV